MKIINLNINNNNYEIACEQKQEQRLQELASKVDKKLKKLASTMPKARENLLLLIALLNLEDELENYKANSGCNNNENIAVNMSVSVVSSAIERIEVLANKLKIS